MARRFQHPTPVPMAYKYVLKGDTTPPVEPPIYPTDPVNVRGDESDVDAARSLRKTS